MLPHLLRKKEWVIAITALLFCLVYWFYSTIPQFFSPMVSSEDGYSRLASGVAWASPISRYPINYVWPPLTSIVYSLAYLAYPHSQYISIRILAWALILLTTFIIGLIGYQLSKNYFVAIFSTCLALTNPLLINLASQTLSENIWLPLVGLSLFFLLSKHQKNWIIGMLFWALSQTVRYESWYLSPLLILIFWFLHRHKNSTITLALLSLVFPLYWYLETTLSTHNFHFYLDEKFFQAKHGSPYVYHHLLTTIKVWTIPLLQSLTPPIIFVFLLSFKHYWQQKNFLFLLPVFIFISLIAQVYFATMEIWPGRYISLLPVIIIPITIATLFRFSFSKRTLLTITFCIVLLDIFTGTTRLKTLTDFLAPEQVELGNFLRGSTSPCVTYVKSDLSPRFDNSAFWYLSHQPMTQVVFVRTKNPYNNQTPLRADCFTIVVEKTKEHPLPGETMPLAFGKPVFENTYFQVYEPPILKERFNNGK